MKKIILILLLALLGAGNASAQIVRSESRKIERIRQPKTHKFFSNFYVKAGGGYMQNDYADRYGKYNVTVGYQRRFLNCGLFWGAQLGCANMSYHYYERNNHYISVAATLYIEPTLGIRCPIGEKTFFESHLGVGYGRLLVHDSDNENRGVWEGGLGIWYKRFLIELEYQGSGGYIFDHAVLLNLGFKF